MAVIRVSGYPGAGKTTLSKKLAEELGYKHYYTGGIFRDMAKEKGMSIEEFYNFMAAHPDREKELDLKQEEIMQKENNVVMEGRVAPFLKCAFPTINVLLLVDHVEGAKRELNRGEKTGISVQEMQKLTEERVKSEAERYKALYGIEHHLDQSHFDIVVDTTNIEPKETLAKVLEEVKKRL